MAKKAVTEQVTYRGDIRLVGLVYPSTDKNTTPKGYLMFVEKTALLRVVTLPNLLNICAHYKVSNLELKNKTNPTYDDIVCTECAKEKLPAYCMDHSRGLQSLDKTSMYVLGTIVDDKDTTQGYRIITNQGKIADISTPQFKSYASNGVSLCNVHIEKSGAIKANKSDVGMVIKKVAYETSNLNHDTPDKYKKSFQKRIEYNAVSVLSRLLTKESDLKIDAEIPPTYYPKGRYYYRDNPAFDPDRYKATVKTALSNSGAIYKLLQILKNESYSLCQNDAERKVFQHHYDRAVEQAKQGGISCGDFVSMCQFLVCTDDSVNHRWLSQSMWSYWRYDYPHLDVDAFNQLHIVERFRPMIGLLDFVEHNNRHYSIGVKNGCLEIQSVLTEYDELDATPYGKLKVNLSKDWGFHKGDYGHTYGTRKHQYPSFEVLISDLDKLEKEVGPLYVGAYLKDFKNVKDLLCYQDKRAPQIFDALKQVISFSNQGFVQQNATCWGDYAIAYYIEFYLKTKRIYVETTKDVNDGKSEWRKQRKYPGLELVSIVGSVCSPTIYKYYAMKYQDEMPQIDPEGLVINAKTNITLYTIYRTGFSRRVLDYLVTKEDYADIYAVFFPYMSESLCEVMETIMEKGRATHNFYYKPICVMSRYDADLDV